MLKAVAHYVVESGSSGLASPDGARLVEDHHADDAWPLGGGETYEGRHVGARVASAALRRFLRGAGLAGDPVIVDRRLGARARRREHLLHYSCHLLAGVLGQYLLAQTAQP